MHVGAARSNTGGTPCNTKRSMSSASTMASAEGQPDQRRMSHIHKNRSAELQLNTLTLRLCTTLIWWRRARISNCNEARVRKAEQGAKAETNGLNRGMRAYQRNRANG